MAGGVLSAKLMCWVQTDDWPLMLVAVQMRSMPVRPVQLAGVATSEWVMVALPPPQLPVAVAVPVLDGSVDSPHCNCLSTGHVRTGAPVSMTVIVFWHVLAQPLALVIVRLNVNELELVPATALTV